MATVASIGICNVSRPVVTLPDGRDKTFKSISEAEAWLKRNGWKKMVARRNPHGFRETFYGKSVKAYDAGEYATLAVM